MIDNRLVYGSAGSQAEKRSISSRPETRPPRFKEECLYGDENGGCKMENRCIQTGRLGDCGLTAFKDSIYANNALS